VYAVLPFFRAGRLVRGCGATLCKRRSCGRCDLAVGAAGESLNVGVGRYDVASSTEEVHQSVIVVGKQPGLLGVRASPCYTASEVEGVGA
jgi:hypothetical protein